jgi:hypothetical protein
MNEIEYNNTLQLFSNRIHANQNYQLYIESENNWINYEIGRASWRERV